MTPLHYVVSVLPFALLTHKAVSVQSNIEFKIQASIISTQYMAYYYYGKCGHYCTFFISCQSESVL